MRPLGGLRRHARAPRGAAPRLRKSSSASRRTRSSPRRRDLPGASLRRAAPNTQACAVDIAPPGVLPVLNKGAVERVIASASRSGTVIIRSVFAARRVTSTRNRAEGLPILQYEISVVQGGTIDDRDESRREDRAGSRARSRGGRREKPARGLRRTDRASTSIARDAAARDRAQLDMASSTRRSSTLRHCTRRRGSAWRRQHAGGSSAATRMCRCDASARRSRYADRNEEPEQLPLPPARDRLRGAPPGLDLSRSAVPSCRSRFFDPERGET